LNRRLKKLLKENPWDSFSLMVKPIIVMEPELELFSSRYFIGAGARAF
jgi:hypothetical protein